MATGSSALGAMICTIIHTREMTMVTAADTIWGLRGQLLGICDAGRDEVKALADRVEGLSFPLLPDDGSVAQAYGALKKNGEVRPMAFIVDRAGKIVWTGEGVSALKPAALTAAFREVAR